MANDDIAAIQARIDTLTSRIQQAESLGYTTEAVAQMIREMNALKLKLGLLSAK